MAGKPQRREAKVEVKLVVEEASYERVLPLIEGEHSPHVSVSRMVEALLLLAKNEYDTNLTRDFIGDLCLMKEQQVREALAQRGRGPKRRLHLTIDREALEFLDMLVERNRSLFHARGEVLTLIFRRVAERLTDRQKTAWVQRRLEEIMLKYPVRY